jgi:hypothetical protein
MKIGPPFFGAGVVRILGFTIVHAITVSHVGAQCTRTITDSMVAHITVGPDEVVCTLNDLYVPGIITIAPTGRLITATGTCLHTNNLVNQGNLELEDNSFLYVQHNAIFTGVGSSTSMGASSRLFACQSAIFNQGATLQMGPNSIFDSFDNSFTSSTNYVSYTGLPGTLPNAYLISRTSTTINGALSASNMIGYCATTPRSDLTQAELGAAQAYCTPLIPPNIYATRSCSMIASHYCQDALLTIYFEEFSVKPAGHANTNHLSWTAAGEGVLYYEIQRRNNLGAYRTIGLVPAQSHETILQQYSFEDTYNLSPFDEYHYRICAKGVTGTCVYSPVRRVASRKDVEGIVLFPNPASGSLTVQLPPGRRYSPTAFVEIFNSSSVRMYFGESKIHRFSLTVTEISSLRQGQYYLKISCADQVFLARFAKR